MDEKKNPFPLTEWFNRFSEDYWFQPGGWITGLLKNVLAIPQTLLVKFPKRAAGWLAHWRDGAAGTFSWLRQGKAFPLEDFGMWWLRLVTKTLDVFSVGEMLNTLMALVKFNTRALTDVELAEAKKVFGDSLDYYKIRLDEWSMIAHIGNWVYQVRFPDEPKQSMAITICNTILFTRKLNTEPGNRDMAWLIHELTHVAQYQHVGSQIIFEALIDQGREGYAYGGAEALPGRELNSFNREQQGDIVKDYYKAITARRERPRSEREEYERMGKQLRGGHY
jgi:hypothetical protein